MRLGNNEGNFSDEAPRHDVAIDRFCVMTSRLSSAHVQALLRLLGEIKLPTRLGYDSDLQQRLIDLGFLAGEADGDVGPQTTAAIRRFQEARSLPVTGEFDSATVESLSSGSEVSLSDLVEEAKFSYTEASALLRLVSERTGLRLRLLREPEWEYLANRTPARVADLYEDWELTSSIYAPYPYVATDGRERADRLDAFRSIRGGALERFGGEGDQYASLRGFAAPGTRYQFRLAASPVK